MGSERKYSRTATHTLVSSNAMCLMEVEFSRTTSKKIGSVGTFKKEISLICLNIIRKEAKKNMIKSSKDIMRKEVTGSTMIYNSLIGTFLIKKFTKL